MIVVDARRGAGLDRLELLRADSQAIQPAFTIDDKEASIA